MKQIKNKEVETLTDELYKKLRGYELEGKKWKVKNNALFTTKHLNLIKEEYRNIYYVSMYSNSNINETIRIFLHNVINYHLHYPDDMGDSDEMKLAVEICKNYAFLIKRIVMGEKSFFQKLLIFINKPTLENFNLTFNIGINNNYGK